MEAKPQTPVAEPKPAPEAKVELVDGRTKATVLVRAGDSLWAIAQKFGVGIEDLCRWNGIRNPRHHKLQIGSALVVFPPGLPPAGGLATPG